MTAARRAEQRVAQPMRGPSLIYWHLLRRGLGSWILARAAFALALMLTASPPLATGGLVGLGVLILTTILALTEVQRVHERVLLANLGVSLLSLLAALVVAPVCGEIILALSLP